MGKKCNSQVARPGVGQGKRTLEGINQKQKSISSRRRNSGSSRSGKVQEITGQSPTVLRNSQQSAVAKKESIPMTNSKDEVEGKDKKQGLFLGLSTIATRKQTNIESSISLDMRSCASFSTNVSLSNTQSDHNSTTAMTTSTLNINSNFKISTHSQQTQHSFLRGEGSTFFPEIPQFPGNNPEEKQKTQYQQRRQRLKVQNIYALPQGKCNSKNNSSVNITNCNGSSLSEKVKIHLPKTKKVTKKQLQKFIPEDSCEEMAETLQNIQESITLYNYKQSLLSSSQAQSLPTNSSQNNNQKSALPGQSQHPLAHKKRILLVDNIIKLGVYFNYPRIVVHNAIALFDILFLQQGFQVREKTLSLYSITALFIALKREDTAKHSLTKLVDFTRQYTTEEFLNCELTILNLMKWQISPPSLEVISGIMIELLENKCFKGCGYMKENVKFGAIMNVLIDLINLKENLTTFGMCLKLLALAVIYVAVILTQECFPSIDATRIELTENIFRLQQPPSFNSTTFAKINNLFSQFIRNFLGLNQISDIALEIQFVAKFIDFFSDPQILNSQCTKNLRLQHEYPNSLQFLSSSKEF